MRCSISASRRPGKPLRNRVSSTELLPAVNFARQFRARTLATCKTQWKAFYQMWSSSALWHSRSFYFHPPSLSYVSYVGHQFLRHGHKRTCEAKNRHDQTSIQGLSQASDTIGLRANLANAYRGMLTVLVGRPAASLVKMVRILLLSQASAISSRRSGPPL